MKGKFGEMEEEIREGKNRRMRKEVAVCVKYVAENNKFLVYFKWGQRIYIIAS